MGVRARNIIIHRSFAGSRLRAFSPPVCVGPDASVKRDSIDDARRRCDACDRANLVAAAKCAIGSLVKEGMRFKSAKYLRGPA